MSFDIVRILLQDFLSQLLGLGYGFGVATGNLYVIVSQLDFLPRGCSHPGRTAVCNSSNISSTVASTFEGSCQTPVRRGKLVVDLDGVANSIEASWNFFGFQEGPRRG